ncbi:MAG: hypothetical protein ACYS26_01685 [Planctomycetota bacterium]|jgi:hypothetical protein
MKEQRGRSQSDPQARLDAALGRLAERPVAEVDVDRALERLAAARPGGVASEPQRSLWPIVGTVLAAAAVVLLMLRPWRTFPAGDSQPKVDQGETLAGAAAPAAGVNERLAAWTGLSADSDPSAWPERPDVDFAGLVELLNSDAADAGRAAALALATEPGSSLHLERASELADRTEHTLWALARLGFEGRAPLERALIDPRRGDAALLAMSVWPAEWREEALLRGSLSPAAEPALRAALQRELLATESGTRTLLSASFASGDASLLAGLSAEQGAWVQAFVAERKRFDELALLALDAAGGGALDAELTAGLIDATLDRRRRARALPVLAELRGTAAVLALVELELSGQIGSSELEVLARPLAAEGSGDWATVAREVRERRELDALYQLALGFPGDGSAGALLELGGREELSAEARAWAWLGSERALDDAGLARLAVLACEVDRNDRQAAAAALVVLARRTDVEQTLDRFDLHARVRERVRTKLSDAMGSAQPSELIGLARELRSALPLTLSPTSETLQ